MSVISANTALAGVFRTVKSMDPAALDEFTTWAKTNPNQFRAVVDTALERPKDLERLLGIGLPAAGVIRGANAMLNRGPLARAGNGVLDAVHGSRLLNVVPGRVFGMRANEALGTASAALRFGREQRALADQLLKNGAEDPAAMRQLASTLTQYGANLQEVVRTMRDQPAVHRAAVTFVDEIGRATT